MPQLSFVFISQSFQSFVKCKYNQNIGTDELPHAIGIDNQSRARGSLSVGLWLRNTGEGAVTAGNSSGTDPWRGSYWSLGGLSLEKLPALCS